MPFLPCVTANLRSLFIESEQILGAPFLRLLFGCTSLQSLELSRATLLEPVASALPILPTLQSLSIADGPEHELYSILPSLGLPSLALLRQLKLPETRISQLTSRGGSEVLVPVCEARSIRIMCQDGFTHMS